MMSPQIIVLKEGTDVSQGKPQLLSNINACIAVCDTIRSTLGPRGMDKLIVDSKGDVTISNDGATILKLLDVVHPAARAIVDIARAQDAEIGDGTTSVTLLAGELLRLIKPLIEDGISPQLVIRGFRRASDMAVKHVHDLAVLLGTKTASVTPSADSAAALPSKEEDDEQRQILQNCASTALSSKIIHSHSGFFSKMVVDAVYLLDPKDALNDSLIGIKRVPGGGVQDSFLVDGVAFKKTFSYAGFEQQPKSLDNPKILALNLELELKAERDNAEVRVERVSDYQKIVDAEWRIIYDKLDQIVNSGANVVLSQLPIGDLATQYFADRDIFCAGRVTGGDMKRVCQTTGAQLQSSVSSLRAEHLGTCKRFEERQVGSERFNIFSGCPSNRSSTIVLRGGAEQFIAEVERSLHDAIMIVRRAYKSREVVAGGGAIEMELSRRLRDDARQIAGKQQMVVSAFAKALEVIPRTLCENAGFDSIEILNKLRQKHAVDADGTWYGVDINAESIADNFERFVWEPAVMKVNCISSAADAACLILSIDETIKNAASEKPNLPALRGRGAPRGRM